MPPQQTADGRFPTRVLPLPDGRTAYTFAMFQGLKLRGELFECRHESLKREFANIELAFAGA